MKWSYDEKEQYLNVYLETLTKGDNSPALCVDLLNRKIIFNTNYSISIVQMEVILKEVDEILNKLYTIQASKDIINSIISKYSNNESDDNTEIDMR